MMRHRYLTASLLIVLALVLGFWFSVPHTKDAGLKKNLATAAAIPAVTLHDSYKKGTHTITGSLVAPDACAVVTALASLAGASSSPAILIAIALPATVGTCLEVPTALSFSTSIAAPANLPLYATVNGASASTTRQ